MIEYVIAQNPDDRILKRASDVLSRGGLVCLPTDTNWVVCADPYSKHGVEKLYHLKKAEPQKHFSVLCDTISRAAEIAYIDNSAFRTLRGKIPGHFTFIFRAQKKITKSLKASKKDHEIGIRFPPDTLVQRMIEAHGGVLLSTNLTSEMLGPDSKDMEPYGYLIEDSLKHVIDIVLDPGEFQFAGASTIVRLLADAEPEVLRQGAGSWDE
ncbi:MAG: L-threonylcarbamoyladenylate synthase [Elusimicrobiota bacterium]